MNNTDTSGHCRNTQAEIDRDIEESKPCSQCGHDDYDCTCEDES